MFGAFSKILFGDKQVVLEDGKVRISTNDSKMYFSAANVLVNGLPRKVPNLEFANLPLTGTKYYKISITESVLASGETRLYDNFWGSPNYGELGAHRVIATFSLVETLVSAESIITVTDGVVTNNKGSIPDPEGDGIIYTLQNYLKTIQEIVNP
jgi:hypothetical protein